MADISKEIQDFRDAIYGEEVRGSLISLAEKVNKEATDASQAYIYDTHTYTHMQDRTTVVKVE